MREEQIEKCKNILTWTGVATGALVVVISLVTYVLYAPIYCDSAYYIEIARQINRGCPLYTKIACGYTPLGIYLIALLDRVFDIANPVWFFAVDYCVLAISTFIVYKTARELNLSKRLAAISTTVFAVSFTLMEIDSIFVLEPMSCMLGLAAILLTLKARGNWKMLLLAGFVASLSFWCKQYGIGFLFLCGIIVILDAGTTKEAIKNLLLFAAGYLVLFLICLLFWRECLNATTATNYGFSSSAKSWYETHDRPIYWALDLMLYKYAPFIWGVMLVPFVHKSIQRRTIRDFLLLGGGIIGFMMSFYLSQSYHYFIYVIPFSSLLLGYLWNLYRTSKPLIAIYTTLTVISLATLLYAVGYDNFYFKYYICTISNHRKATEIEIGEEVKKLIPEDASVYNASTEAIWLNLAADLKASTRNGRLDYGFGPLVFDTTRMKERISTAEYAIYITDAYDGDWKTLIDTYMPGSTQIGTFPYGEKNIIVVRK